MLTSQNSGQNELIMIGIGEYHVGDEIMSSIGLGSCIGLIIHDSTKNIGGLAHIMLPQSQGRASNSRPGKYADTAVVVLIDQLKKNGCNVNSLSAKLAGGASMFKNFSGNLKIGERNAEYTKKLLKELLLIFFPLNPIFY